MNVQAVVQIYSSVSADITWQTVVWQQTCCTCHTVRRSILWRTLLKWYSQNPR